jgi:hypothetical protein
MSANVFSLDSVCVDALCVSRDVEYRGIYTATGEVIFHKSSMSNGTNDLGEFLAIVHAIASLKNQGIYIPIYSDSQTAISWINKKKLEINLSEGEDNKEIFNLIKRALNWLDTNDYKNPVLKWNNRDWGSIPVYLTAKTNKSKLGIFETGGGLITSRSMEDLACIAIFGNTQPVKDQLKKARLIWNGKAWVGRFPLRQIEIFKRFCNCRNLQYVIEGDGFKESRLPPGSRPLPNLYVSALMGEGRFQWEIEETLKVERLRNRKRK